MLTPELRPKGKLSMKHAHILCFKKRETLVQSAMSRRLWCAQRTKKAVVARALNIRRQVQKSSLGTDHHDLLSLGKGFGIYSKCIGSS